ncbi:MAG TPA: uroporphyrinogen decarboxylase [Sandaracinaceae bacterium LLY-WYZ-13_1]|nr:uroporphyrinogen decarboxylase [Sandaracinaceae bacterium LLY-WYZ-13_1]
MSADDSVFLRACRREPVPHTPIWLMRQAGRYQASYQKIRSQVSFVELCRRSDLACQVTVDAVDQLGVDAAILFADILLILEPLGVGFHFEKGHGPRIDQPLREPKDVDRVAETIDAKESLGYVMETVRLIRRELEGRSIPLIGFSGAPFTLASYAIEGGGSRDYHHTKTLMYSDEGAWNTLMDRMSRAITGYLAAQIDAGAQAVQLFDSWVGALSASDYRRYVQPHVEGIFDALADRGVPRIHFGQGNPALYPLMKEAGGDVISVDWRLPLDEAWDLVGPDVAIQGNLDPVSVLAPREVLFERAQAVLDQAGGRDGHVFNLGHGILKYSSVDQAKALVDYVHERSAR